MQALRDRFQPPVSTKHPFPSIGASLRPRVASHDNFTYVPASPTVKAPSLPSTTPKNAMIPAADHGYHRDTINEFTRLELKKSSEMPEVGPSSTAVFNPDTAARQSSDLVRRASAMRKQVAAGDLAMSHAAVPDENGGAYFRPAAQTPGLSRMDTWRGRLSTSTIDLRNHNGVPIESSPDQKEETFELREAVLLSIAKSIGLAEPTEGTMDSIGHASLAPSVSAVSTPNSPMFPPGGRNSSKSPFGNVLDMMNASTNSDNILGGMLRDAVFNARVDDEMSSVSGNMQESQAGASSLAQDRDKNVLRDLEGNVEILFFKQGITLVKEGERSPGIYYVIDGFLEVSVWFYDAAEHAGFYSFAGVRQ